MSIDEYESLLETIEILADRGIMKSLERSRRELAGGRKLRHTEVWDEE